MEQTFLREILYNNPGTDWMTIVIVLILCMIASTRIIVPRFVSRVFQAFTSSYEAHRMMTEKNVRSQQTSFILLVVSVLTLSLFAVLFDQYARQSSFSWHPLYLYLIFIGILTVYLLIRHTITSWLGFQFQMREATSKANNTYIINLQALGVLLAAINLIIPYVNPFFQKLILWLGVAILICWGLYTAVRVQQVMSKLKVLLFYRFLYLCAFEILPWWWVIRTMYQGVVE